MLLPLFIRKTQAHNEVPPKKDKLNMTTNTALDNVLADAQAAAANYTPPALVPGSTLPQTAANTNSTALAKPSMQGVLDGGGLTVDEYLQNKSEGFRISKDMKGLVEEMIVEIDLADVTVIYSSRHEQNGSTKFLKSYDGVTTAEGENFQAKVAHYDALGYKGSGIYQTVEIPAELKDDVKDPKSSLIIHAGTMIGITPSLTGFKPFQKFIKNLNKTNPELVTSAVDVKVTHLKRTNANNNEWGVCEFELIGAAA
jgi:hypothetical protein